MAPSTSPSPPPSRSPPTPTWTSAQERRLQFVTKQLYIANKRWSSEQEVWYEEVEELSDLKRKYVRAVKMQARDEGKGGRLVRVRSFGGTLLKVGKGRTKTVSETEISTVATEGSEVEEVEDADDVEESEGGGEGEGEAEGKEQDKSEQGNGERNPPRSKLGTLLKRLSSKQESKNGSEG